MVKKMATAHKFTLIAYNLLAISKMDKIIPITVPKNPIMGAAPEIVARTLTFYPNPASNNLTVDLGDVNGVNTTIKLYDGSSKLVFEKQSTSTLMIDVSGFARGMYSIELATDEYVLRSQVIID